MKCFLNSAVCCCVFILGNPLITAQTPDGSARGAAAPGDGLPARVVHLERELDKQLKLLAKGFTSVGKVDQIRASLAKAQHDLALSEDDPLGVADQRRALLEIRERQLRRLQNLQARGYAPEREVTEAQRRLAINRYLVAESEGRHSDAQEELRKCIKTCAKELELWQKAAGQDLTARSKLIRARHRLIWAKYQLAKVGGHPETLIPQLRDAVETWESELTQVKQLYDRKQATIIEDYVVRTYLLNAKLRLASVEEKSEAVPKLLKELIRLHEQLLKRGRAGDWGPYYPRSTKKSLEFSIAAERDRDTQRLEEFMRNGLLGDDLTIAQLAP